MDDPESAAGNSSGSFEELFRSFGALGRGQPSEGWSEGLSVSFRRYPAGARAFVAGRAPPFKQTLLNKMTQNIIVQPCTRVSCIGCRRRHQSVSRCRCIRGSMLVRMGGIRCLRNYSRGLVPVRTRAHHLPWPSSFSLSSITSASAPQNMIADMNTTPHIQRAPQNMAITPTRMNTPHIIDQVFMIMLF